MHTGDGAYLVVLVFADGSQGIQAMVPLYERNVPVLVLQEARESVAGGNKRLGPLVTRQRLG